MLDVEAEVSEAVHLSVYHFLVACIEHICVSWAKEQVIKHSRSGSPTNLKPHVQ